MRLRNPVPASWIAIEQSPDDGTWSVVRCYPGTRKVRVLRAGIKSPESAVRYIEKHHKPAFGHNMDIDE